MERIKAIETIYNGNTYRSRLEARWAIFLDACGMKWEYETEGFELSNGMWYLPDFLVHDVLTRDGVIDLWIEVKGAMSDKDLEKTKAFSEEYPVLVVGDIPNGIDVSRLGQSIDDKASEQQNVYYCWKYVDNEDDSFAYPMIRKSTGKLALFVDEEYFNYYEEYANYASEYTVEAYDIARQARFEYGEDLKIEKRITDFRSKVDRTLEFCNEIRKKLNNISYTWNEWLDYCSDIFDFNFNMFKYFDISRIEFERAGISIDKIRKSNLEYVLCLEMLDSGELNEISKEEKMAIAYRTFITEYLHIVEMIGREIIGKRKCINIMRVNRLNSEDPEDQWMMYQRGW